MLLDVAVASTDWMEQAACRDSDPEIFFDNPARAKAICAGCPVVTQCRLLGQDEASGVFGGLDASDRMNERERERQGRRGARQERNDEARRLYLAGESFASIAERLGLTVTNAKRIIYEAADTGAVAREGKARREALAEGVRQLHGEGMSAGAIVKATGLPKSSVYSILKRASAA